MVRIAKMWETREALYHFHEKERAEYHTGEIPELKHVVLDDDFFISISQLKDMDGIHAILDSQKEAKDYVYVLNKSFYEGKIKSLVTRKEHELNVAVVDLEFDEQKNLYLLASRLSDDSYVAWTSYNTGDLETSYENFYNGKYDMSREEGLKELERRAGREHLKEMESVTFLGCETVGNLDHYDFVEESSLSTKETTIIVDFDEGEITGEQVAYGSWVDLNHEESMEYLNTLDEKDIVRSFEHIKSPIRKEKGIESEMER